MSQLPENPAGTPPPAPSVAGKSEFSPEVVAAVRTRDRQVLGYVVFALFVFVVILVAGTFLRQNTREYRIRDGSVGERKALLARLRTEYESVRGLPADEANTEGNFWKEDTLQIAIAVEEFTLRTGRLPHSLTDLGLADPEVAIGLRLVSGGSEWRLYGPNKLVIALGD